MTYNLTISGFFLKNKNEFSDRSKPLDLTKISRKAPNLPEIGRSGADLVKQLLRRCKGFAWKPWKLMVFFNMTCLS